MLFLFVCLCLIVCYTANNLILCSFTFWQIALGLTRKLIKSIGFVCAKSGFAILLDGTWMRKKLNIKKVVFRIFHSRNVWKLNIKKVFFFSEFSTQEMSHVFPRMYGGVLLLSGCVRGLPGHNIIEQNICWNAWQIWKKGLCIVGDNICVKASWQICEGQLTNMWRFMHFW